jgi:hypothetical protein
MNKYGRQAQEAWKAASPTRYSQIQNPEEFFTKLGEEAQEQVDELLPKIAPPETEDEEDEYVNPSIQEYLNSMAEIDKLRQQL